MKKMDKTQGPRQGIQVIARAAAILRVLENKPDGLSLGEIAKEVELPRSTVQRIISALDEERFVIAASPNARVRLGPGLMSLGSAAKVDIDRVILPFMKQLSDEIEETVDLSVQDDSVMVFIEQITTEKHRLMVVSAVGQPFPIHCCANGKAVLATLDDREMDELLEYPLIANTKQTITKKTTLKAELKAVRKTGIAYDLEEQHEGLCAVGTCISGPFGQIAISIPVPAVRFYGNEKKFSRALTKYRKIIELALGKET
jgi:DNA-binding IclR family transcriptional regulator